MKPITNPALAWIALAAVLVTGNASAGIEIDRNVEIRDELGGRLTMITTASHEAVAGESTTTATFAQFQAREGGRIVDGEVVRERERTGEALITVYHGAVEIRVPAVASEPARLNTLVFENLTVTRRGLGLELSGRVIYNGEEYQADALPPGGLRLLKRALRFFRHA